MGMLSVGERAPAGTGGDWSRALTLTERRDLYRAGEPSTAPAPPARPDGRDLVRRHQYWAESPVHATVEDLQRRLAADGISLAEYDAISRGVAMPADAARRWPWVDHLDAVCRDWTALQALPDPRPRSEPPAMAALASVVRPFRNALLRDLGADLEQLRRDDPHGVLAGDALEPELLRGFEERAREFAYPAALLELHVIRYEAGLAEPELLQAAEALRERMQGRGGPAFLDEYPVMARTLAELSIQHRRNAIELARRVRDDAALLAERFAAAPVLGRLVEVGEPWGDPHQDGRTVRALRFASGVRVLYKPRPLAVDVFVADFLRWLNTRGIEATQRPVLAVDRGHYGWTEVIEPGPCPSPEAVERFYRRQGGLVAVCHVLAARDLHFENVIAEGEYPVAVDLEGFFQPPIPRAQGENAFTGGLMELLETGLLPSGMAQLGDRYTAFDGSGMAGSGGVLPMTMVRLTKLEEGLRYAKGPAELPAQPNLPVLDGERVHPRGHASAVEAGFREVAETIRAGAGELLGPGGRLEQAAGLPVRIFLRASSVYGGIVAGSTHPDLLRDALDRERLYDALWGDEDAPAVYRAAFPHERRGLLGADVPMFVSTSDGLETCAASGEGIGVLARRSGLGVCRERVARLDAERIDGLAWVVRAGIAATVKGGDDPSWPALVSASSRAAQVPAAALRERAVALAGVLARRVERGPFGTTWAGLAPVGDEGWSLGPLDLELYNGNAGVVLFLAYAGACTGEALFTERARAGLDMIRRSWEHRLADDVQGAQLATAPVGGAYGEFGGTILALTHLSVLWERDDLAREALELSGIVARRLDEVGQSDVIAGVAGTLSVVLTLHEALPDDALLRLATRCGELLAGRAVPRGDGLAWLTGEGGYLAGFAHGAAGIGAALARLARVTGEPRWGDLAAGARAFEDSLLSAEHGNWLDARTPASSETAQEAYPVYWCHGAPGVALSRAIMFAGADDAVARDLRTAVGTTVRARVHHTHCLCHGSFGNLLVLRRCRMLGEDVAGDTTGRLLPGVLDTVERHGIVCGVPDGVSTPGFMMGTAGIGYALLALSDPSLPTVVGLDDLPG